MMEQLKASGMGGADLGGEAEGGDDSSDDDGVRCLFLSLSLLSWATVLTGLDAIDYSLPLSRRHNRLLSLSS